MAAPEVASTPRSNGSGVYEPFPSSFCGDPLWDRRVTWDTDYPRFTQCFQKTVLVWAPCVFLWVMLPIQSYRILSSRFKIRRWTWLSIAKTTFSLLLFLLAVMDMSYVAYRWSVEEHDRLPDVDLIAPLIKAATFLLSIFFIYTDKRCARPSSAILFLFWFLVLIESVVVFEDRISRAVQYGVREHFLFVTAMIYLPVTLAQFILSCFAEYFPEREHGGLTPCPELFASFPNRLTFEWFTGLARLGWKRPLVQSDLWDINPQDRTQVSTNKLEKYWHQEMAKFTVHHKDPSLLLALMKTFWIPVLVTGLLKLLNDVFVFVSPQILQLLIGFTTDKTAHTWKGYFYAVVLLIASFAQTIILAQYFHMSMRIGMHVRSAVVATVYRKALRITAAAKRSSTVGEIVNLMSVDSQRFMDLMAFLHLLWSSPLQMALAIYFLYNQLGPSVFAGLGVMILMVPVNAVIAARTRSLQIAQMKQKDGRIKLITEILNGMKVLKLYAWEESFLKQILGIRDLELETLKKAAYLTAFSSFTWILSPFLVALVTFAVYVLSDEKNVLDSQKAFVSLSLFNILRFPLSMLPMVITSVVQAKVSVERLTKFLKNEELDPENVKMITMDDNSTNSAITVSDGSFSWGKAPDPIVLSGINLDVKQGKLIAVVGQVGSGKSSLIAAMLGLMERRSGSVRLKGSISYVSQQAWIQNLTLKENILFGRPLDETRYKRVIEACALGPDLEMLPGGDQTEIGEKGINLSGGQKQRVSLARAVYSGADVCFLDDPLSAVDAHVGKHLFENVLGPKGLLAGKTRILVTHGISFLPQTDLVVVIGQGTISEVGTYQELLQKKGAFAEVLRTYLQEETETEDDPEAIAIKQQVLQEIGEQPSVRQRAERTGSMTSQTSNSSMRKIRQSLSRVVSRQDSKKSQSLSPRKSLSPDKDGGIIGAEKNGGPGAKAAGPRGGLVGTETSETGSVKWNVYTMYLKHMTYGASFVVGLFYLIFNGVAVGTNVWLGEWSNDSYNEARRNDTAWRDYRLGVYGALGGVQGIFVFMSSLVLAYGQIRASRNLHQNMLVRIMHAPMSFFDTTPLGRIVNRFSKDVDTVDTMLPMNIRMWLNCVFSVLSTVVVICMSVPLFATVILPLGVFYYFVQRFYIATSRQLKRLESVSRSPIYSHFQESVTGTMVIVATKQTERFIHDNENRVDTNNASYYPNIASQRWLAVRLESVGNLITFFAAFFAVITRDWGWVDPKDMGLAVSYAMTVTQTLNWMVRMTSELETNVVSVERIKEYTEIPMEADWVIEGKRPPANWPQKGAIEFNDYQTRYRPGLDLVLRGVNADISPREKIGIVGRTGAGKSSLTLALFRIIEPAGGAIIIDGIDIFSMGLHDVRSHLTIIPQEPVLFSGTLRLNLDPFNAYSDDDVWMSLENSHLKRFVSSLPDGLQHPVAEGGENLSVGQRQLICLARALLRKTKILVLDEATAAVDLETDDLIQRTIRDKFADCTILTIAHRLNTIMDSTRIMVLDQGRIKELDSAENLLRDRNTIFYGLAKDANLA